MSDSPSTPAPVPAGWYPDPAGGPGRRWWDGTAWTEQVEQPYSASYTPPVLGAPAGTAPYTPWIWTIVLLPLLSILVLFTVDMEEFLAQAIAADTSDPFAPLVPTQAELVLNGTGIAIYAVTVLLAFLDWRELRKRRVDKPFHFAWAFLSSLVYVIGRSIVVRRRVGTGSAPMWVAIGVTVLSVVVGIGFAVQLTSSLIEQLPALAP